MSMKDFEIEVVESVEVLNGWDNAKDFAEGFLAGIAVCVAVAT